MSIEIKRSDKYVDYNISAANNRGYITIDTSDWINKPWMFYELPALKFEIYTETDGELVKYQNFSREIRTYNPVYSPLGVLNVTIDIRNVPEEFILRITPIFDNDAVAARNMLIENGIESGDIWGSDQDVPTQLFNLNIEFIECEGEYVPPTPPVPPTHEETITGVPPITFDGSTGEPLVSWTILGNSSQSGTPTPDNPVIPEMCGVRTYNLLDFDALKTAPQEILGTYRFPHVLTLQLKPNTDYTLYANGAGASTGTPDENRCIYFNGSDTPNVVYDGAPKTENSGNDGVMKIGFDSSRTNAQQYLNGDAHVWLIEGTTPLPYEPYGYKIPISCAGQTTPVYLGEVPTVRRVRKLVLTGEETIYTGSASWYMWADALARIPCYCTHAAYDTGIRGGNSDGSLFFAKSLFPDCADSTEFKAFLASEYAAGHPMIVWFALIEPQTGIVNEPLAKIGDYADELHSEDVGVSIPTVKGSNVLTVDTPIQPSEMTITYIKEGQ